MLDTVSLFRSKKLIRSGLMIVVVANVILFYSNIEHFQFRARNNHVTTRAVPDATPVPDAIHASHLIAVDTRESPTASHVSKTTHVSTDTTVPTDRPVPAGRPVRSTEPEGTLPTCVLDTSKLKSKVSPGKRLEEVENDPSILARVLPGGRYAPPNCTALANVAIIVPYRDREEHKVIFLRHMHSFLQKQQLQYTIYLVELTHASQFNRALLMNVGFVYASNVANHTCYVFHDVDLLPVNEFNLYTCKSGVTHMSSNSSKYYYKTLYSNYVGGVIAFTGTAFRTINGFSNLYFGWGQEDDDLHTRIKAKVVREFKRQPMKIGVYEALFHKQAPGDEVKLIERKDLKSSAAKRQAIDGLNSLVVRTVAIEKKTLYTKIIVEANETALVGRYKECVKNPKCPALPANSLWKPNIAS